MGADKIQIGTSSNKRTLNVMGKYQLNGVDIFNIRYPVGSIYISTIDKNPGDLFGIGVWERIQDKFLFSSFTKTGGSTGGTADKKIINHQHVIPAATSGSAGAHTHSVSVNAATGQSCANSASSKHKYGWSYLNPTIKSTSNGAHTHTIAAGTSDSGGSGTGVGDNLPPYKAFYAWRRIDTP